MMNKKGFTLIELTAVIVLIGLISLLAISPINKLIKDSKEDLYFKQVENIILGAKNWASDHPTELPPYVGGSSNEVSISIDQMLSQGYFDEKIVDPAYGVEISGCSFVKIKLTDESLDMETNVYRYEFVEVTSC